MAIRQWANTSASGRTRPPGGGQAFTFPSAGWRTVPTTSGSARAGLSAGWRIGWEEVTNNRNLRPGGHKKTPEAVATGVLKVWRRLTFPPGMAVSSARAGLSAGWRIGWEEVTNNRNLRPGGHKKTPEAVATGVLKVWRFASGRTRPPVGEHVRQGAVRLLLFHPPAGGQSRQLRDQRGQAYPPAGGSDGKR